MTQIVTIDSRVSGYDGKPVRVKCAAMPADGMIIVQKLADFDEPPGVDENTMLVTDSPDYFPRWQLAFYEDQHIKEVVKIFFQKLNNDLIKIESDLDKNDPKNILELRKIDKVGSQYEFDSSQVSNGHMAVLLAVWACARVSQGHLLTHQDDDISDEDDPMMPYSLGG